MVPERLVLGLSEKISILGNDSTKEILVARIDTGATSSSIDEKLAEKLKLGPVIRQKLVKSASGHEMRDLVIATVEIAGKVISGEFSIANRNNLTYPALIGQNVLIEGQFLIDPLKSNKDESKKDSKE